MAFPREKVKTLIYELVIDGDDGILANAAKIHRESISAYLAARSSAPDDGLAKPILGSLIPYGALVASSIERSLSTSMGWRLDTIFAAVAAANYKHAFGGRGEYVEISGSLSNSAVAAIDRMMDEFVSATRRRRPSQAEEVALLESSATGRGKNTKSVRLDVFFLDGQKGGVEWALESKTIKPNKGQLQAAKRDALTAQALKITGMPRIPIAMAPQFRRVRPFGPSSVPTTMLGGLL